MKQSLLISLLLVGLFSCTDSSYDINASEQYHTKIIPVPSFFWDVDWRYKDRVISEKATGGHIFGDIDYLFESNEDGTVLQEFELGERSDYEIWITPFSSSDYNLVYREDQNTNTFLFVTDKDMRVRNTFETTPQGYSSYTWYGMDISQDGSTYTCYRYHGNGSNDRSLNFEYYQNGFLEWSRNMPYDTITNTVSGWWNRELFLDSNNNLIMFRDYNTEHFVFRIGKDGKTTSVETILPAFEIRSIQKFKDRIIIAGQPYGAEECAFRVYWYDLAMNLIKFEIFPHCDYSIHYAGNDEIFVDNYFYPDEPGTRTIHKFDMNGNELEKYPMDIDGFTLVAISKNDNDTYTMVAGLGKDFEYEYFLIRRPASQIFDLF